MAIRKRILVVDDEPRIRRFVRMNLELEGYDVSESENGMLAVEKVRTDMPDLVLMDVMMPAMDGFEALERLRSFSSVPVIMLTVKGDEDDLIHGLDLGADDYVTKPFSPRALSSRIRAVLRRVEPGVSQTDEPMIVDEHLSIDFPRREVIVNGERVKLRPTEYRLLTNLVENAGWIVPHETLLSKVWGPEYRDDGQLLRLYITYLRKKIEADPANPRYILTERGVGYQFARLEGKNAQ
jgi:two-component system, OmpR family, KDP operon response regulator KdpE